MPALAQFGVQGKGEPAEGTRPAAIERNAPAENLLKKAEDAIRREDWKLAIDSLQRVLDDSGPGLMQADNDANARDGFARFEKPSVRARAMLAALPADGMAAYRILHDGRAQTLYAKTLARGGEKSLAEVVLRYPISSVADNAAERLAGMRMDLGDATGALELLDFIADRHPDPDVSARRLTYKRAVCLLMVGDRENARELLDALEPSGSEVDTAIRRLVESDWRTTGAVDPSGAGWGFGSAVESWPMVGGGSMRRGCMPAVAPELRTNVPWRFTLPSDYPDWWENYWEDGDDELRHDLPVGRAVVADGRVFVRSLRGFVALDLDSLEPLWVTESSIKPVVQHRVRRRGFVPRVSVARTRYTDRDRMLYDQVGALVSVAGDLVFTVQREDRDEVPEFYGVGRGAVTLFTAGGTMLVARSAKTGDVQWTRGRTAGADDTLGHVEFLSAPLVVDGELWCVYARDSDLFLGVLDPVDGRLDRELLLCSADATQITNVLHEAIYPAFDGRRIYMTAGVGLVMSVDVASFSLCWATSYPRLPTTPGAIAPMSWLPGPPRCVGSLLVAAPPDSDLLLALDRTDGSVRWVRDRPADSDYVLATDDHDVWLGGERFFRIRLRDGAETWATSQRDRVEPTGRAALSGSKIFVPTRDELLTFDANTGVRIESVPLPEDQLPLGNLLCIAGALISTDTNEVRKFPDLTLSYPQALARHERNPNDRRAAIRLAWMELLRDAPGEALTALKGVDAVSIGVAQTGADVTRLRVDALVGMARREDCGLEESIEYLQQALRIATTDRDRLRAGLALAGKLRDAGRAEQAYLTLWEIGLSNAGSGYVTIEPRLRNKARRVIGQVLGRFERELTARQLAAIADRSRDVIAGAREELSAESTRAQGLLRLRQLAELNDAGGAGQLALILLARTERESRQFERSEQDFRAAIASDRTARLTALAMLELADMYVSPSQDLYAEAAVLLDRLDRDYRHVSLPEDAPAWTGADVSAAVDRLRMRVSRKHEAASVFVAWLRRFEFVGDPVRTIGPESASLFAHAGSPGEASGHRVLLQTGSDVVTSVAPDDGTQTWSATLALLGHELDVLNDSDGRRAVVQYPRVFLDGQTGVINGSQGTFAVGMLTGRRLWGVPYESPETASAFDLRNRLVAVKNGCVVYAPRRGVLAAASVRDGADLLWERVLSGDKIDTILLEDGYCITLDNERQLATTYNASDGRLRSRIAFTQPRPETEPISAAYVRGHIVVPDGLEAVACYGVATGALNWRVEIGEEVRWIFKPGEDLVGIACHSGRVVLVDVLGGDTVFDQQVAQAAGGGG